MTGNQQIRRAADITNSIAGTEKFDWVFELAIKQLIEDECADGICGGYPLYLQHDLEHLIWKTFGFSIHDFDGRNEHGEYIGRTEQFIEKLWEIIATGFAIVEPKLELFDSVGDSYIDIIKKGPHAIVWDLKQALAGEFLVSGVLFDNIQHAKNSLFRNMYVMPPPEDWEAFSEFHNGFAGIGVSGSCLAKVCILAAIENVTNERHPDLALFYQKLDVSIELQKHYYSAVIKNGSE